MKMRWSSLLLLFGLSVTAHAQIDEENKTDSLVNDKEIILRRFEPKLNITANKKRRLFKKERLHIDTMQISDKKKERLLNKLYKDIHSGKFEKTILTTTSFEN